jgi:hypothetical protein
LGWFRDNKYTIEDMAREKGEKLQRMTTEELIDAPEDLKQQILDAQRQRHAWMHRKDETAAAAAPVSVPEAK